MSMSVFAVISVKAGPVQKKLTDLGKTINQAIQPTLETIGTTLRSIIVEKYLSGPRPKRLGRVTGELASRTTYSLGLDRKSVRIGNNLPYGAIHEFGGLIRPTRSQYLTIPIGEAKTRAGAGRQSSARDFQDTFIQRSRGGALMIFQKKGSGILPLFILKKQVNMPARPYLRPALIENRKTIIDIARKSMQRAINQAGFA